MKKWIVLIVAVLMGLMLFLQYLNKKTRGSQAGPAAPPPPQQAAGVSLPPEAANTALPVYTMPAGGVDFSAVEALGTASCEGGSIRDILASKGKTWGLGADDSVVPVLKGVETQKVEKAVGDYFTCVALATRDLAMCNYAPERPRTDPDPGLPCEGTLKEMLFASYMAGKYAETSICNMSLATADDELKGLTPSEFCPIAAKGMENICSSLPAIKKSDCLRIFPARESDCGGDKECLDEYNLYLAAKSGNPAKCSGIYRNACGAFFSQSQKSCSALAEKASKLYCGYMTKAKANWHVTIKQKREEELNAERQKLETEKTIQEINKEIKKLEKAKPPTQ